MREIWKTINKFSQFQVSNLGRVRRKASKNKSVHLLKINPHGRVTFCFNNRQATRLVYRLVLKAFAPNKLMAKITHKNGNIMDNRLSNLTTVPSHKKSGSVLVFYPVTYYQHGSAYVKLYDNNGIDLDRSMSLGIFMQWLHSLTAHYHDNYNTIARTFLSHMELHYHNVIYRVYAPSGLHYNIYRAFLFPTASTRHAVTLTGNHRTLHFSSFSLAALWIAYHYHYSRSSAKEVLVYNSQRDQKMLGYRIKLIPLKR